MFRLDVIGPTHLFRLSVIVVGIGDEKSSSVDHGLGIPFATRSPDHTAPHHSPTDIPSSTTVVRETEPSAFVLSLLCCRLEPALSLQPQSQSTDGDT